MYRLQYNKTLTNCWVLRFGCDETADDDVVQRCDYRTNEREDHSPLHIHAYPVIIILEISKFKNYMIRSYFTTQVLQIKFIITRAVGISVKSYYDW